MPESISQIKISNTKSTKISPDVEEVIARKNSDTTLNISYNKEIICDKNVHWMAKYAMCQPNTIIIEGASCSDGRILTDYLKRAVPDPCKTLLIRLGSDEPKLRNSIGRNPLIGRLSTGN